MAIRIRPPDGEVATVAPAEQALYEEWKFAPVRRAGDFVYVSGVVGERTGRSGRRMEPIRARPRDVRQFIVEFVVASAVSPPEPSRSDTHGWRFPAVCL